jgi:hypothetical protein
MSDIERWAEKRERVSADAYRAIGRYVVEFSQLMFFMRSLIARRLTEPDKPTTLADLALGQIQPVQLTDAFFAACLADGRLDSDEKKIGRSLRARVLKESSENRNDLAHGDWWIGGLAADDTIRPSTLVRIKPAKEVGAHIFEDLTVDELDRRSDDVLKLALRVHAFGSIALGFETKNRVREIFAVVDKQVVIRGDPTQWPPIPSV